MINSAVLEICCFRKSTSKSEHSESGRKIILFDTIVFDKSPPILNLNQNWRLIDDWL